jgi:hypothetical protein
VDLLLSLVLLEAALLVLTLAWYAPRRRGPARRSGTGADPAVRPRTESLLPPDVVRRRLAVLAAELDELDRGEAFAKAFHVHVARQAYEALLDDAAPLSEEPGQPGSSSPRLQVELDVVGPGSGRREVLDV